MVEAAPDLPHGDTASVFLSERRGLAQVGLRGDADDPAFTAGVSAALQLGLPERANTVSRLAHRHILWLGPDEWLVVDDAGEAAALVQALSEPLTGRHVSVVDLSAARVVFELVGPRARDVLEKGCLLDLHPRAFASGQCAGTIIAQTQIYLEQTDDCPCYRLYARPSFSRHLTAWLIDAMAEFVS